MEFLFIKDPHIRLGFPKPIGRSGNFESEVSLKWDFLKKYAKDHKVKYLLIAGDLYDRKTPSDYTFNQIKLLDDFWSDLSYHFKILAIPGNHDLPFASLDYYDKSVFSYFSKKYYIDVSRDPLKVEDVFITGVPYTGSTQKTFDNLGLLNQNLSLDNVNVVMAHHHFAPWNERLNFVEYSHYEDLMVYDKINLFLFGHLHHGYDFSWSNLDNGIRQKYVNPWSMVRLTRDYYRVGDSHSPQFCHINIKRGKTGIETFKFPFKPYSEVFIDEEVKLDEGVKISLSDFSESLKGFGAVDDPIASAPERIRTKVEFYLEKADRGGA